MAYNSIPNNYYPHYQPSTRRITLKLEYIKPEQLFEQYYLFYKKPEDSPLESHGRFILRNKRKEPIESLQISLEKLKLNLEEELFPLALRYEAKRKETLNIYNCYRNQEYCEITEIIKSITIALNYPDELSHQVKERQERLQDFYIRTLKELYEKQTGIWINDKYCIIQSFDELKNHHEQYWERRITSVLE